MEDRQLHLQSWLVACENEKGLWWRYCASKGNKICNKLHSPRKSSKKRDDLKNIFISDEWASHKPSRTTIGHEVEGLIFNHAY